MNRTVLIVLVAVMALASAASGQVSVTELSPSHLSIEIGSSDYLTVTIDQPAGMVGVIVDLTVDDPTTAIVPTNAYIPTGSASAEFQVSGVDVGECVVTASVGASFATAVVTVFDPAADSDGDGLSDVDEQGVYYTDYLDPDTDNDGIDDFTEVSFVFYCDPLDADSDDDGLSDGEEDIDGDGVQDALETDAMDPDTDGDHLSDGLELGVTSPIPGGVSDGTGVPYAGTAIGFQPDTDQYSVTDPLVADSDADGIIDGDEDVDHDGAVDPGETDPNDWDTDGDGLNDGWEASNGLDPLSTDSDQDGLGDDIETDGGLVDTDDDGIIDALDTDSDDDGYLDGDPLEGLADDDQDGVPNYRDPDSPADDTDGDGLADDLEATLGLDPGLADTDGDGIDDFTETDGGSPVDTDQDGTIDALDSDSDADGIADAVEGAGDPDADGVANYRDQDSDGDTLADLDEGTADPDADGTPNFLDLDSDDDQFGDADEAQAGSDPYDPASTPDNVHDPAIVGIADVGNDQGRRVRLAWTASNLDVAESPTPILSYSLYRRIDAARKVPADMAVHAEAQGFWDFVANMPATGDTVYNMLAETLCDSTDAGLCWSVFFVRALTATPTQFYDSQPDSGYSIDNLAPSAPQNLVLADGVLRWDDPVDADFDYFTIYGSDTTGLSDAAVLGYTTGTYFDVGGADHSYLLVTATDFAGNEGLAAVQDLVTGVGDAPAVFRLLGAAPNPFNPRTTISFELPDARAVDLRIYDASGRLVRDLVRGSAYPAGRHGVEWDGRSDSGRAAPSGVYFYRLAAGAEADLGRMLLLK